jgi:hypothetical protein
VWRKWVWKFKKNTQSPCTVPGIIKMIAGTV